MKYCNCSVKRTFIFLFCAFVMLSLIINFIEVDNFRNFFSFRRSLLDGNHILSSTYIGTAKCRIPDLNISDGEIMDNLKPMQARPYSCGELPPLVLSNLTSLYVNVSALNKYGIKDIKELKCWYIPFRRVNPKGNEADHGVEYGTKKEFVLDVNVEDEFVEVKCEYAKGKYKDFHSFAPLKNSSVNSKRVKDDEKLNVIIMGTDNLSRLHFHRIMPKTLKFLQDLKAIELLGYNKLGENSFPNLIPLLTGHSAEEIKKLCLPTDKHRFDNCSFVWQNYSQAGYLTGFGEEISKWSLFNYFKNGWIKQPTDYYWNTFDYTALSQIGKNRQYGTYPTCMGIRPMYKELLNYGKKFFESLKNNHFFSFLWVTTLSHDDDIAPVLGEEDYIKHLKFIQDSGTLNKSLLIFMSDHGPRYGKVRGTVQGYYEERLPYIFFVLPEWFQEKYPVAVNNLRKNAYRLTTHYDVHATLNHILHLEELVDQKVSAGAPNDRSVSLFRPISMERTCTIAGIPIHYCTCQESSPVNKADPIVQNVSNYAVRYLNNLLKNYTDCATLNLAAVTRSSLTVYNNDKNKTSYYYSVSFTTMPGEGWFDVTVYCNSCKTNDFKMSGTISRFNTFGNTSHCIVDPFLKLYCYCKKQLNNV